MTTDERELLSQLRGGDEAAFTELVGRHHASMVRLARGYVRSATIAEEVAQDAWLGMLRSLDTFEGRSSLRSWLYRIVINRAISAGRRERVHVPVRDCDLEGNNGRFSEDGYWVNPPTHWADEVINRVAAAALTGRVHLALDGLPLMQRQVVTLRDVEGLTSNEVCEILDLSAANQRVLLHRARAHLRDELEREIAG